MSFSLFELEVSGVEDEGGDIDILSLSSSDKDESYENEEGMYSLGIEFLIMFNIDLIDLNFLLIWLVMFNVWCFLDLLL